MEMDENCYGNTSCHRQALRSSEIIDGKMRRNCNNGLLLCTHDETEQSMTLSTTDVLTCRTTSATCQIRQYDRHCSSITNTRAIKSTLQPSTVNASALKHSLHAKQTVRIQSKNYSSGRNRKTLLHHLIQIALVLLISLTAPSFAQGTAESKEALSQLPSSHSVKELFYPLESWSIEELPEIVATVPEEATLQMTHSSANVGYLFKARIMSTQILNGANEEITSLQFKVTFL